MQSQESSRRTPDLDKMRANLLGVIAATFIAALSSCVYVPPQPARPYPYAAPVPSRRTATGIISCMRPRLALGAWARNPFWPMGRRALRAKRGPFAEETAAA